MGEVKHPVEVWAAGPDAKIQQLERGLAECREKLAALRADKQDDLDALSNMLAAAEAEMQYASNVLMQLVENRLQVGREMLPNLRVIAVNLRSVLDRTGSAALDAALEQARANAKRWAKAWKRGARYWWACYHKKAQTRRQAT